MNFRDHAANRRVVGVLHHLLHAAETQTADRLAHPARATDEAYDPLDLQSARLFIGLAAWLFLGRCHCLYTERLRSRLFRSLASIFGYFGGVLQMQKRVKRGLDDVVRIRGAQ